MYGHLGESTHLGGGRRARRRDGVEQPVLDGLERPEQELDDEGWRKHLSILEVEADRCERPTQDLVQIRLVVVHVHDAAAVEDREERAEDHEAAARRRVKRSDYLLDVVPV